MNPASPTSEKSARQNAAELAAATEGFDVEKALNTQGFVEFLARFQDSKEGEIAPEVMQERFEVFETKNEIAGQIKEVYKNEISQEIGIKLDGKDLECVDAFLDQQAFEDPRTLFKMKEDITAYRELPGQIAAAQQEISTLAETSGFTARIAEMEKTDKSLETATKGTGKWGTFKMYAGLLYGSVLDKHTESEDVYVAQWTAKQKGIPISEEALTARRFELAEEADAAKREFEALSNAKAGQLEGMAQRLAGVTQKLFAYDGLREQITAVSQEKLKTSILSIANSQSARTGKFAEALDSLSRKKVGSVTGLEYITDDNEAEIQQALDNQAERYVAGTIYKKLKEMKFGANTFSNLQKSLEGLISRGKLGSKSEDDSREFVITTLLDIAGKLPADKDGTPKKILVKQLVAKLAA